MTYQHDPDGPARAASSEVGRRKLLQMTGAGVAALGLMSVSGAASAMAQDLSHGADNFYRSPTVSLQKVTFATQYRTAVVGNLFMTAAADRSLRLPAIVVGHPMGAVKEQSSNLYAQKLAEQGFVTLALDLPFWGESEGEPRNAVSPDFYSEAFSAAVDFLRAQAFVDPERIGVLGICGSGSFAISAAKLDPRMKAIATVSMYDMGAVNRDGLRDGMSLEQRKTIIADAARRRDVEFAGETPALIGGTVLELTPTSNAVEREFYDFYRTPRGMVTPVGATPRTTTKPTLVTNVKFMNFYPLSDLDMIAPRPMLLVAGEIAHSREFSEDAFAGATGPKELHIVPGAGHVDLYDRVDLIPFDRLGAFFARHLAA
jgi:fermentation-respiration switch protein FrsA (DUF1100 family)